MAMLVPGRTSPTKFIRLALILLVFSPGLFTAHLVWTRAVDVGTWDVWENAPLLQKWHDGTLTWHDLYAPQIQHRIVVPRLIIIALSHISGGDFRWEQYANFVFIATASFLLWQLLKRSLGESGWKWPMMFAFNLLIFSPMHYQQLLWGSSLWSLIPVPCLLGTLLLLTPRADAGGTWWRAGAAVVLAEIGTHSFAHGLAIWPVMLGILLVNPVLGNMRHRAAMAGVCAVIGTVTVFFYFQDFINVASHAYDLKPGDHALSGGKSLFKDGNLHIAVRFFFAFMGTWFARTPFIDHPLDLAVALGQFTFLALIAVVGAVVKHRLWKVTLPWLALAGYVVIVGLMVSKRGADIGEHRAVTPRYLAVSQYMLIAGIAATGTMASVYLRARRTYSLSHQEGEPPAIPRLQIVVAVLLAVFCTAQIPVWQYGLHLTEVWHRARLQSQALLLFLPHLQSQGRLVSMETLDKESANWHCIDAVNTLLKLDLLRTRPLATAELKWFAQDKALPESKADVLFAKFEADGTLQLSGHARFNVGLPADAVLIVQDGKVIALGQPAPRHVLRIYGLDYEFSNATDVQVPEMYPWSARVRLQGSDSPLELWALDVQRRCVCPLRARLAPDSTKKEVRIERP